MLACPRCGSPLAENQRFCATCGYQLASTDGNTGQQVPTPAPSVPYYPAPTPTTPAPPTPSVPYYPPITSQPVAPQMHYYDPSSPLPPPKASGDNALDRFFGASPNPATVQPANVVQKTFQERLPQYATNPIIGAAVGAVAAVIACIVLVFAFTLVLHAVGDTVIRQAVTQAYGNASIADYLIDSSLLNIVAFAHHATLSVNASALAVINIGGTITLPMTLLLLLPAISLTLGGYISAATDYSNQLRFVLLRAAAVGPIYGILMTLVLVLFGSQQLSGLLSSLTLGVSFPSMLLYGIIWGTFFGLFGGLIKVFGQRWRAGTVTYLLSRPRAAVVASITGALAAVGTGLLLCMPLIFFAIGFAVTQQQLHNGLSLSSTNTTPIGLLVIGLSLLSLPGAIWIFAFGSGASIDSSISNGFTSVISQTSQTTQANTISLFHLLPGQQFLLLLVLIPAIAYFVGGRVAARVLGVPNQQKQMEAGALMGVFSSILMFLLAAAGGVSGDVAGSFAIASVGPNLGSSFLGALIFGVVFGALGGYLYRFPQPKERRASRNPLFLLYDGLTRQPRGVPRQAARNWLYSAVTLSIVLGIIAILAGVLGGTFVETLPYNNTQTIVSVLGGLMLAVPLLLFAIALMADTASTPPGSEVLVHMVAQPLPLSSPLAAQNAPFSAPAYPAPSHPYPGQYPSAPYGTPQPSYPPMTGPYTGQPPTPEIYPGQQPPYPPATGPYPGQQPPYTPTAPYPGSQPAYPPGQYQAPQQPPAYAPAAPYPTPQPQYPYPGQPPAAPYPAPQSPPTPPVAPAEQQPPQSNTTEPSV